MNRFGMLLEKNNIIFCLKTKYNIIFNVVEIINKNKIITIILVF